MNDEPIDLQATVAALRADVESLKAELELMKEAVRVKRGKDGKLRRSVECESVVVRDCVDPRNFAIHMGTTEDVGAFLHMHYRGEEHGDKTAVSLKVTELNEPLIQIRGTDRKMRVGMWLDKDHGTVGVMRPGDVPGAVMRALPKGGSVAVVQANGRPRALMMHEELPKAEDGSRRSQTELVLLGPKGEGVFHAKQDEGGGILRLKKEDCEAMLVAREMASVVLEGPEKASSVLLVATDTMAKVAAQQGAATEEKASAALGAGALGGSVSLREATGTERVNLSATKDAGRVALLRKDGKAGAALFDAEGEYSHLKMRGAGEEPGVTLWSDKEMAALRLHSPQEPVKEVTLMADSAAPSLLATEGGEPRAAIATTDDGGVITAFGPGGEKAGIAAISGGKTAGGMGVGMGDGTRLVEIGGTEYGGRIALNNDLGFQRILMGVFEDSSGLHMNCTGKDGVNALATPHGGMVGVCDAEGKMRKILQPDSLDDAEDVGEE